MRSFSLAILTAALLGAAPAAEAGPWGHGRRGSGGYAHVEWAGFGGSVHFGSRRSVCRAERRAIIRGRVIDDRVVPGRISRHPVHRSLRETVRSPGWGSPDVEIDPACRYAGCVYPERRGGRGTTIIILGR